MSKTNVLLLAFDVKLKIYFIIDSSETSRDVTPAITPPSEATHEDDDQLAPSLVVYLVEPFTMGTDSYDLQRLACLALLRCFQTILGSMPDHIRTNISVQVMLRLVYVLNEEPL